MKIKQLPQEDIDKILSAGINAPGAMNTQPWHFTAVADEETNKVLADAMKKMKSPAPPKGDKTDMPPPSTEAGTPPADAPKPPAGGFSKASNKAGIGNAPLTIVVSCKEDNPDAVSTATTRNAFDEVVSFVK